MVIDSSGCIVSFSAKKLNC